MSAKFALTSLLVLCVIILVSILVVGSSVNAEVSSLNDTIAETPPIPGGPKLISISHYAFQPYELGFPARHHL